MTTPTPYRHPHFKHFLKIHLGTFQFDAEAAEEMSPDTLIKVLRQRGFPFNSTKMGQSVSQLESEDGESGKLICGEGESTETVLQFLFDKTLKDFANGRTGRYGPIVIAPTAEDDSLVEYYDKVIRYVFNRSIARSLFADPTTMKTSWYGQVNAHSQKRFLDDVLTQLMSLKGISLFLTSHFNTRRGDTILRDGARSASMAISLLRQINEAVPHTLLHTLGFACTVQHFGALCDLDKEYFPGVIDHSTNESTIQILSQLGLSEKPAHRDALSMIKVDPKDVIYLIRHRHRVPEKGDSKNIALINCLTVANRIVATYFTKEVGLQTNGSYRLGRNPYFGQFEKSMDRLDAELSDVMFYKYHRKKIEQFIMNADRYFRLHMGFQMERGAYISKTERQALRAFQS